MLSIPDLTETAHHREDWSRSPPHVQNNPCHTPVLQTTYIYFLRNFFLCNSGFFFYLGRIQTINALNFFTIFFAELQTSMLKFKWAFPIDLFLSSICKLYTFLNFFKNWAESSSDLFWSPVVRRLSVNFSHFQPLFLIIWYNHMALHKCVNWLELTGFLGERCSPWSSCLLFSFTINFFFFPWGSGLE